MRISLWFRAIAWSTQDGWCNIVDLTGIWLLWDSMIGEFLAEYFFTSKRFWVYNLTKFEWMILNDFECFSFRVIAWWPTRWLMILLTNGTSIIVRFKDQRRQVKTKYFAGIISVSTLQGQNIVCSFMLFAR